SFGQVLVGTFWILPLAYFVRFLPIVFRSSPSAAWRSRVPGGSPPRSPERERFTGPAERSAGPVAVPAGCRRYPAIGRRTSVRSAG
ncbi:hypothetical protein AB0F93_29715, partial [Micromonospora tulbaghiae]|uniref:hypothetical protein n=1 Tax=Micromonospora tulbaghiae TaxID=479978 RepID=UPI0033FC658A